MITDQYTPEITDEEYQAALDGLNSQPQKHLVIGGVRPQSVDELIALAKARGYVPKVVDDTEPATPPTPVKAPTPAPKAQEVKPKAEPATPLAPVKESTDSDVEIPDLGTLSFNQMKALAKSLGISPVPNTQTDLVAAIEAKRAERES